MKSKKSTIQYILKQNWQFSYDRKMTYQKMRLFSHAYINDIPRILHADFGPALHRMKNSINSEYLLTDKFQQAILQIEGLLLNKKSVKTIIRLKKIIVEEYRKAVPFVNKMPLSYTTYSNADLGRCYERYCSMEKALSFATVLLFTRFEEPMTNALNKLLKDKLGDVEKVKNILEGISLPTRMTPLDMYKNDLLKITLKPQKNHPKLLSKFAEKYISWGQYDVNYDESSFETHKENFQELNTGESENAFSETLRKYKQQKKKSYSILNSMKGDRHLYHLMDLYICYADYKDWKNFYREQSSYKLKILLKEIGLRLKLNEDLVAFLVEGEIKGGLKGASLPTSEEMRKRMKNSIFLCKEGRFEIITNERILEDVDRVLQTENLATIKGIGAYRGLVRGRVKIIISNEDLHKLNEGDILVTGTTRPDYIQAMVRAGGFVTNEGGLLSHAAIVARELKKPCIIGTKIATKVLKDGDMVEVDANRGIVTKIN